MALKTILNKQTDFTGEFPEEWAKGGLWPVSYTHLRAHETGA